jgi:CCR4-NOT transcription complex subunit 1
MDGPARACTCGWRRVLLERLVVNRPHPWGLLITFIELIKTPRYAFWDKPFIHVAPELERLFDSVAKSCMVTPGAPAAAAATPDGASA